MIILSSEVGVTDVDESTIIKKERLHPGKMLLIDTEKGKIISDEEIKKDRGTSQAICRVGKENPC